jgi:prevent-host-death family protein
MKISKSDLKPKLFSYLRKVSETGRELVITEHGKPVLKIIPISESEEDPLAVLKGMVDRYDKPLESVGVIWKAAESDE